MADHEAWVTRPFVDPGSGRILYHPDLPADSFARRLSIRPLRALIRPWIMPDSYETASKLWAPTRHARHPRVWGWLLACTDEDFVRAQLRFDGLYHYKRFAEEILDDDDPEAIKNGVHIFDSLPIALIRIEMMTFCCFPAPLPTQTSFDRLGASAPWLPKVMS